MRFTAIVLTVFMTLFWSVQSWASESEMVDTGRVDAQLVSSHDAVAPGDTFHVALRTLIDPEWHTYWENPGDSGEPVQITWNIPDSLTAGEIIWPLPSAIPTGPLINYGFSDLAVFPVPFTLSGSAALGDVLTIEADIYYLVCKDICIPEQTVLSLNVIVGDTINHERWDDVINLAIASSPKPGAINAGVQKTGGNVVFKFADLPEGDFSNAYFFPWGQGIIDHSAPPNLAVTDKGVQIKTLPGFDWDKGKPKSANGVLSFVQNGEPRGIEVEVSLTDMPDIGVVAAPVTGVAKIGLIGAVIGALIGGLILNIMPCVFPVISIKALSITKAAHGEQKIIRHEAWAYTLGVLATFLALTITLLALKAGGHEIGWGFQLQDPRVVGFLALLLFAVGLNLLGAFDIAGSFQNTGQKLTQSGGWTGSFFTGVLAVIVATPCTAPFMAGAIGYAFTQPSIVTVAIFMALGFGFALPFLLIAYIPALSRRLPKPGEWMIKFKELLAFPMFAAAIWLIWVLTMQSGEVGLRNILISMLVLGFAIWLLTQKSSPTKILGLVALIVALAIPMKLHSENVEIKGEAWSNEKVAELRAEGRPVFVDFTAAWCVSCKVNEITVLNSDEIRKVFKDTNTAFLIADWTNKNDVIARELEKYGRSGVPLYLLYPPGHDPVSPEILPQILTKNMLREKLTGL